MMSRSTIAVARASRVPPSASAMRMLRDTSTSTGTTRSRSATGGSRMTGRQTNTTTSASASARSRVSVQRCARVSGASGRRYDRTATTPIAAAASTAAHHGIGDANSINGNLESGIRNCLLRPLPPGERLEVVVDLLLIGGRRLVVDAGGKTVARVSSLELTGQFRFGVVEGERHLLAQLLPLREVLLERLGARRGHHHALALEGEADAAVLDRRVVAADL